jgi:hypothetical protein
VTSAFVWCVVLTVLLFPWQSFLIGNPWNARATPPGSAYAADAGAGVRPPDPAFKLPGGLYTWEELGYDVRHFADYDTKRAVLKWARYAGFPVVALLLLLMVQAKSSRGLKFALGESEVQVEVSSPHV